MTSNIVVCFAICGQDERMQKAVRYELLWPSAKMFCGRPHVYHVFEEANVQNGNE